jgi:dipeptidyl aminopeptidase/acylaminoacyl peptidase
MNRPVSLLTALVLIASVRAEALHTRTDLASWTVEDVVFQDEVSDFQVSRDGRLAVWIHLVADRTANEQVGQLVRCDLPEGRETVLTRGKFGCTEPRLSPDGKLLAFLASRPLPGEETGDAQQQIWLIDPHGGEPWPLTEGPRKVLHHAWAGPDALVIVAQEAPTLEEKRRKKEQDDSQVVEDEEHEPPARLFRVDVASKRITRLTDNRDRIDWLAVSPDGRHAVASHGRSLRYLYDNRSKPAILLHDLDRGTNCRVFAEDHWNIQHVRWAPDGRGFYAINMHNSRPQLSEPGVSELHHYDLAARSNAQVDLDWERGLTTQEANEAAPALVPVRDGFLALLANGVRPKVARYVRTDKGWRRQWLRGKHAGNLFGLTAAADGRSLLYAHATASTPTQWYRASLDGERIGPPQRIATINAHLNRRRHARTEVVRWRGGRDEEVEGILYYPHRYEAKKRHPLVVMIHGGPAGADLDCWEEWWMYAANLLCQRGAFVLKPNYHGSSDYGLKWLESIGRGRYCEAELIDIEKGVDALIERGLVDPERLGLQGWSNGAILTNHLTVATPRYRAAVAGAGSLEYVSDWASCEFGEAFDRFYLGKTPLEDASLFQRKSPFYRLQRVRTPTLVLFGTEDRTVAPQQGWLHYRGLQQLGKAPVRFVLFPGEKHILEKLSHQRRKLEEELAWFDRYLFEARSTQPPPYRDSSPLAWALKRRTARRDGARLGVLVEGKLIPETVSHEGVQVGRFEVTRAQFARFDHRCAVEPGRDNHPASGISFAQARAYCDWLSRTTGRDYRLPTTAEADKLYLSADSGENTLDHWAGHTVNPEDAARLRQELEQLGGEAPLAREVGSFRAVGEVGVFDLGGNLAEWVMRKDGTGALRGGSADTPADARARECRAGPAYRGFRVILAGKK